MYALPVVYNPLAHEPRSHAEMIERIKLVRRRLSGTYQPDVPRPRPTPDLLLPLITKANTEPTEPKPIIHWTASENQIENILEAFNEFNRRMYLDPALGPIQTIVHSIAHAFGIASEDILGKSRLARLVRVRHIAMAMACRITKKSLPEIGRRFRRDHTTVLHGRNKAAHLIDSALHSLPRLEFRN